MTSCASRRRTFDRGVTPRKRRRAVVGSLRWAGQISRSDSGAKGACHEPMGQPSRKRVHQGSLGEKGDFAKWKIIDFRGDFWHHTQRILSARKDLKENRVVHISVRGQPNGDAEWLVQNKYRSFSLEPPALSLIELLGAPVLPCFALPDSRGNIVVSIYPRVPPAPRQIMNAFGSIYSKHLNDHPEFTRIWRRVMRGDLWW